MSWQARNEVEHRILDDFAERLAESDEVSEEVAQVITNSLEETTISQRETAEQLSEEIVEKSSIESD